MKNSSLIFIFLFISYFSFGQKKCLNESSYSEWKKVDSYHLSPNGRWVIYRYAYWDQPEKTKEIENKFYLYDHHTGKSEVLDSVSNPVFCGNGGWLMYNNGTLRNLKNRTVIHWDRETLPQFKENDDIVSYTSMKGKKFVILNLQKMDSIVYENISQCQLYDHSKKMIYLSPNENGVELRYGAIAKRAEHRLLFVDSTKQLQRFSFNPNHCSGTFEIGDSFYDFDLLKGSVDTILNAKELFVDKPLYIDRNSVVILKNRNFAVFDVYENEQKAKEPKNKKRETIAELWGWDDLEVPSVRSKSGNATKANHSLYLFNKQSNKINPICDHSQQIYFSDSKNSTFAFYAVGEKKDWEHDSRKSITVINLETGENRVILNETTHLPKWSANGDYIIYFNSALKGWFSYDPRLNVHLNLSKGISVYDEQYDRPNPAGSYGLGSYTDDGKKILLYDQYDVWLVSVDGKTEPYCLSKGYGRANNMTIRLFNPLSVPLKIDLEKDLEVETFNHTNKEKGFYTLTSKGKMIKNFEGPYFIKINKISNDASTYLYQRQSFSDDRDLWISDHKFKKNHKITDANPQQKEYKWGRVELFEWVNYDGEKNSGLLFLPDDYKKGESYPTIVSFYETHTEKRYIYQVPSLSSAMIDIATYVSNGYIVFQPDVRFVIGKPGESSYNAVVSGTKALIEQGMIDSTRIGLQGHSWSGYQVSYLVTRTNLFKCVNIGAAVTNMTSSYTGLRDGSGLPRMFMFEDWQCRMGKPLWEDKRGYIENSPLLFAEKIHTPALIFHCDKDEAVSYSEGRNLFLALRRLERPAWLLNYNGEGHFLSSKAARQDWTRRMQQFFDYYLKNSDKPCWMNKVQ